MAERTGGATVNTKHTSGEAVTDGAMLGKTDRQEGAEDEKKTIC